MLLFPALRMFFFHHFKRQSIATIQLTPEEAEDYRKTPVVLDFRTGFYVFPVSYLSSKFLSSFPLPLRGQPSIFVAFHGISGCAFLPL
jgi:hypothetical protein